MIYTFTNKSYDSSNSNAQRVYYSCTGNELIVLSMGNRLQPVILYYRKSSSFYEFVCSKSTYWSMIQQRVIQRIN